MILEKCSALKCQKFVTAEDIASGHSRLNLAFVASLFNTYVSWDICGVYKCWFDKEYVVGLVEVVRVVLVGQCLKLILLVLAIVLREAASLF